MPACSCSLAPASMPSTAAPLCPASPIQSATPLAPIPHVLLLLHCHNLLYCPFVTAWLYCLPICSTTPPAPWPRATLPPTPAFWTASVSSRTAQVGDALTKFDRRCDARHPTLIYSVTRTCRLALFPLQGSFYDQACTATLPTLTVRPAHCPASRVPHTTHTVMHTQW